MYDAQTMNIVLVSLVVYVVLWIYRDYKDR